MPENTPVTGELYFTGDTSRAVQAVYVVVDYARQGKYADIHLADAALFALGTANSLRDHVHDPQPVFADGGEVTVEECCDRIEAAMPKSGSADAGLGPAEWLTLFNLLRQLVVLIWK